jgi:hypothetical protein
MIQCNKKFTIFKPAFFILQLSFNAAILGVTATAHAGVSE